MHTFPAVKMYPLNQFPMLKSSKVSSLTHPNDRFLNIFQIKIPVFSLFLKKKKKKKYQCVTLMMQVMAGNI